MKKKILSFFILLIAWIIIIPLFIWMANLPNSLDYWLPIITILMLLISTTISYPLLLIWKKYRKKIKNISQDKLTHIKKIDKISLSLALIISIILTLLLLSTYTHSEGDVTKSGIVPMIQELFKNNENWVAFTSVYASMLLFCFELLVSYLVISILLMQKKSKM